MIDKDTIVKIIAAIMAIIGIILLIAGILTGPSWFTVLLGGGFLISAGITCACGLSKQ